MFYQAQRWEWLAGKCCQRPLYCTYTADTRGFAALARNSSIEKVRQIRKIYLEKLIKYFYRDIRRKGIVPLLHSATPLPRLSMQRVSVFEIRVFLIFSLSLLTWKNETFDGSWALEIFSLSCRLPREVPWHFDSHFVQIEIRNSKVVRYQFFS